MGFLNRLLGRQEGGGSEPFTGGKLMGEVIQLTQDAEKALSKSDPRLRNEVAARLDKLIELCQQFSRSSEDYITSDNKSFVRVDMSKRQQLASGLLPQLIYYRDKLKE